MSLQQVVIVNISEDISELLSLDLGMVRVSSLVVSLTSFAWFLIQMMHFPLPVRGIG
jgi:hypothetical protein